MILLVIKMKFIRRINTYKLLLRNPNDSAVYYCSCIPMQRRKYSISQNNLKYSYLYCNVSSCQSFKCLIYNRPLLKASLTATGLPIHNFQKAFTHSWFEKYASIFMSISESTPVISTQKLLTYLHDSSGLPWWATIAITTAVFRVAITAPLSLYQHYILAKAENLKPELSELSLQLRNEINIIGSRQSWSNKKAKRIYVLKMREEWRRLVERDNCHPAKGALVVLFQLPGWIFFSMSIRNLVSMRPFHDDAALVVFQQLQTEGLLWISNLTFPDTTLIVPTLITLCSFGIIELQVLSQIKEPTRFQKYLTRFFRCIALITFPLSALVPSCLSFYWLCSTSVGLCQNIVLMSPRLKSFAGIPKTETTLSNPYRHVQERFQQRLRKLKIPKL